MRKALVALLWSMAGLAWSQGSGAAAYIRQIQYVELSCDSTGCQREVKQLFMLYVGAPATERMDALAERVGVVSNVSLVHPVRPLDGEEGTSSDLSFAGDPRGGWYVSEIDSQLHVLRRGPLVSRRMWNSVPVLARLALLALGPEDRRLILISWNGISGSLSIFFDPALQTDKAFFERKLEVLQGYLKAHEKEENVPYDLVPPYGVDSDSPQAIM